MSTLTAAAPATDSVTTNRSRPRLATFAATAEVQRRAGDRARTKNGFADEPL